ncbi:hypothetical protein EXIGLDRAFT_828338 [Exidia glandulosa HHB12029]|uniref:Uncharacterized protein n=1 Tax=Exidia glandulosa HHB12029 TaxID=1314781 RepID=A0A166BRB3_EXIGL|nr:hypothetical protein EXIGLDRAFT_828338 [Exidia glandulosa HHB12029]
MAFTHVEVQSSHNDDTSGDAMSTLKWDTLRTHIRFAFNGSCEAFPTGAVHGGISVDQSPIPRCGRSGERYADDGYADDELNNLGVPSGPRSPLYRESDSKKSAGTVSLHHPGPFAVLPVTPHKPRRVYDSDTSASPSVGSPSLWPFVESPGSAPSLDDTHLSCSYPENERDVEMTPGDLCSIRTPDLHRVAPTMTRDRVQQNINQAAHLPAYLGRVVSSSAKYDGLQASPAKFEVVEEDEDDVDFD